MAFALIEALHLSNEAAVALVVALGAGRDMGNKIKGSSCEVAGHISFEACGSLECPRFDYFG